MLYLIEPRNLFYTPTFRVTTTLTCKPKRYLLSNFHILLLSEGSSEITC